jgi:dynein heavy chain
MGEKYVTPPIISFESIFDQSTPNSPIVFILSPGSDPASDLMKLAERIDFGSNKLKFLSMGQGQEKVSRYSLKSEIQIYGARSRKGQWKLLEIRNSNLWQKDKKRSVEMA